MLLFLQKNTILHPQKVGSFAYFPSLIAVCMLSEGTFTLKSFVGIAKMMISFCCAISAYKLEDITNTFSGSSTHILTLSALVPIYMEEGYTLVETRHTHYHQQPS